MSTINESWYTSKTQEWATPQQVFDDLNAEFHFTLDPCCTHENAKCEKHYTIEDDGLTKSWGGSGILQSSLQRSEALGQEVLRGISARCHGGHAGPGPDGYPVVPQLDLPQGGAEVYQGKTEIWQQLVKRTFPEHDCGFQGQVKIEI